MRDSAVLRWMGGELLCYPPGRGDAPFSLEDAAQRTRLQELLRAGPSQVIFAVPGTSVRLQQLHFQTRRKRHLARSLPFALEEEFASEIDALHIAWTPMAGDEVAVAAVEHAHMAQWQQLLRELPGIRQWIPEPLLLPWRAGELTLVIEAGQALARFGEADGFAVETELLADMLAALDSAAVDTVVLYGADQQADVGLVPAALRDRLQWRHGGFGAALLLSGEASPRLNLLQGRYAPSVPLRRWWRQWRWPVAALGTAFALQLLATYVDYRQLTVENLRLRQQTEAAYRLALPEGVLVDPERQLRRSIGEIQGVERRVVLVALLEQVGRILQAQPNARISSLNFNGRSGELRLNLQVPDFEMVENVRAGLNRLGLQATVENSSARAGGVRARLNIRAADP